MPLALQTFSTVGKPAPRSSRRAPAISAAARWSCAPPTKAMSRISSLVRSTDPGAVGASRSPAASVTHRRFGDHGGDRPPSGSSRALAKAARAVGGPAIRNMATVGGNLFAPAPYGDFAVALLALDATVEHR